MTERENVIHFPTAAFSAVTTADQQIRLRIADKPILSVEERSIVARSVWKILDRAKSEGVKMGELAKKLNLGSGEAKELYNVQLPPNSDKRRLAAKAHCYVRVLEVLSKTAGHSFTGQTSDLLRGAFKETSYWPERTVGADAKQDLMMLLKKCNQHVCNGHDLSGAYDLLLRFNARQLKTSELDRPSACFLYSWSDIYGPQLAAPPHINLGSKFEPITDVDSDINRIAHQEYGDLEIQLSRDLCVYFGPDASGAIAPQFGSRISLVLLRREEKRFYRVIKWEDARDRSGLDLTLQDHLGCSIPEQQLAMLAQKAGVSDDPAEPKSLASLLSGVMNKRVSVTFRDLPMLMPLNQDSLDEVEKLLEENDSFGVLEGKVILDDVVYGPSQIAALASCLIRGGVPWDNYPSIETMKASSGEDWIERFTPPGGWHDPQDHPYLWSLPDLAWLSAGHFCRCMRAKHEVRTETHANAIHALISYMSKGGSAQAEEDADD